MSRFVPDAGFLQVGQSLEAIMGITLKKLHLSSLALTLTDRPVRTSLSCKLPVAVGQRTLLLNLGDGF